MSRRDNKKLTAWLGLVAIWLIVSMPMASQWLNRTVHLDAVLCSGADARQGRAQHSPAHIDLHSDACDYCSFFAYSPALGVPVIAAIGRHVQGQRVTPVVGCEFRLTALHLVSYPRAPPVAV